MKKLAQIQKLIESDITQVSLPEELGAGPAFNIQSNFAKRPFKGKRKN
jgi:hypothetical protein